MLSNRCLQSGFHWKICLQNSKSTRYDRRKKSKAIRAISESAEKASKWLWIKSTTIPIERKLKRKTKKRKKAGNKKKRKRTNSYCIQYQDWFPSKIISTRIMTVSVLQRLSGRVIPQVIVIKKIGRKKVFFFCKDLFSVGFCLTVILNQTLPSVC